MPPSPLKITGQLINAFRPAALLAALQLELFNALGNSAMTGEELAAAIGVQPRRLLPVLNVLLLIGLLRREGERYANSEEAAHYLVKGKPSYIGGIHELYADLHRAVLSTADSIRTDRPAAEHDFTQMSDEALAAFFRGLHGIGIVQGRELAKQHDFSRFERLVDVGGGSGSMAIGACEACPGLRATVLDLGRVVPIAQRFISEAGLTERITATFCDITAQPSELTYDVAVLRSFIQVLSPEQAARAIRNIGRSMRLGGEIYVLGYVLDDTRSSPWEAAAYDVAFINIYQGGQSYTDGEYRRWLRDGGFDQIDRKLMGNNMSLVTARKR
jgi:O-methyltransferase domain/Dimerisation domain